MGIQEAKGIIIPLTLSQGVGKWYNWELLLPADFYR